MRQGPRLNGRQTGDGHAGRPADENPAGPGARDEPAAADDGLSGEGGDDLAGEGGRGRPPGGAVGEGTGRPPGGAVGEGTGSGRSGPGTLDLTRPLAADTPAAADTERLPGAPPGEETPGRPAGWSGRTGRAGGDRRVRGFGRAGGLGWVKGMAGLRRWLRGRPGSDPAGRAFALVTALPALVLIAWLVPGSALLLAGRFGPVPMVLTSVPVVVALLLLCARDVPGGWPGLGTIRRPRVASAHASAGGGGGVGGEASPVGLASAGDQASAEVQASAMGKASDEAQPGADGEASAGVQAGVAARVPGKAARPTGERAWAAWWGLAGTVAVAAGFAAWQFVANSPQFIVSRDPGAYVQFGYWIAQHGSLPVPASLAAFGGAHPGLSFSSFGFASQGGAIVPQFMAGLPIALSAGLWAHGVPGAALVNPLLGALAVLAVGGLTGRLAGLQWAPAGALLLALTVPEVYTSRSAFSEPLVQALLFGGLCLVIDALSSRHSAILAALGGLAMGLTPLAGAGSLLGLLPVILFEGALLAARRPQALPFGGGLIAGAGLGLAAGFALGVRGLGSTTFSLGIIGIMAAAFAGVTAAGAVVGRLGPARRWALRVLAGRPLRWLPDAGGVLAAGVAIAFAIRPYVQTVRGPANAYVAALQRLERLPVDPGRLYAEKSLDWVIWYLGLPALLLGVTGLALITRRCLRALLSWQDPAKVARVWALPLAIIGWGFVTVLWQPGTVPDQPWASRRLVPVVLPGLVVLAVWVCAWLTGRARAQGAGTVAVPVAAACFVAALALPPASITFDIGPFRPTTPSVRLALAGLAFRHTGAGELAAVRSLCGALPVHSSVLLLDQTAAREFAQVIRGLCDVPAGAVPGPRAPTVGGVISGIVRAGRRPVLLASRPAELAAYGAPAHQVIGLVTRQDAHVLTQPPTSTWPASYALWMSEPGGLFSGS